MSIRGASTLIDGAGEGIKLMADANHAYAVGEAIQPMLEYDTTFNLFHEHQLAEPHGIFEQVKATGGRIRPPQGLGMGIAHNEDFVQKYRVA